MYLTEIPTSRDLKIWSLFLHYWPSHQIMTWKWLRTLHEVLHDVHTIKIRFHHCNDEIIFVSD